MTAKKKALAPYLTDTTAPNLSAIDAYLAQTQVEPEAPPKKRGFARMGADAGISLLKGAIAVPEAAVGLADMATGGQVGKALENEGGDIGFRPKQARAYLDTLYSPEQQEAFRRVHDADGMVDTAAAALENPSVIAHSIIESLPSMGAGGVAARGAMAVVPRIGGVLAGALGEGAVSAGQTAEQVRQETKDGLLTPEQAAIAAGSGAATSVLGLMGGKIAKALGLHDVDTMLAGAAKDPVAAKGLVRGVLEGAASEGLLEELPQSVQEQMAQNLALGKPIDEGVDQAAVLGALSGGAMGGGANLHRGAPAAAPVAPPPPPSGPMGRAVQAGIDWETVNVPPPAPAPMAVAPAAPADNAIPFEADKRFESAPIYPNGEAPPGQQFGSRQAANIALGQAGLMGSHEVTEPTPGVFEIRPSAAPDMRMLSPGVYDAGEPPPVAARTPLAMPSQELLRAGVDPLTGELPPPAPPPATPPAPGERPTVRADDGTQRAVFGSEQEALDYISQARRRPRNTSIREVPVELPNGNWSLAKPSDAGYQGTRIAPEDMPDAGAEPESEVLNSQGKPFTTKQGAIKAAKVKGDGWSPVKVDGGFVVRKAPMQASTEVVLGEQQPAQPGENTTSSEPIAAEQPNAGAPAVQGAEGMSESRGAEALPEAPAPITSGETAPAANGEGTKGGDHDLSEQAAAERVNFESGPPPTVSHATDSPEIDLAAHQAATSPLNDRPEPTDAQKEAGNYAKGHHTLKGGLNVSIENPKSSMRRSKADAADKWHVIMPAHYGYIRGTTGADGDHVDLTIGDRGDNGRYWVINQNHPDGKFDEHKVMTGVDSAEEAEALYKRSFANGFGDKVFSSISGEMDADELKRRLPSMSKPRPVKGGQRAEQPAAVVEQPAVESPAPEAAGPEAAAPEGVDAGAPAADAGSAGAGVPAAAEAGGVVAPAPAAPAKKRPLRFEKAAEVRQRKAAEAAPPVAAEAIVDVGEKIGGARKDTARKSGGRIAVEQTDDTPGWRKRYVAMEDVRDMTLEKRPWHLVDKRTNKPVRGEYGRAQSFESREAAEAAIPLAEVARNHRPVTTSAADGQRYTLMREVSDRKRVQVVEQTFASREEALRYMLDHAVEIIETKTSFGEEILPKPDNAMRTGAPRRTEDAKAEDFLRDYGLRAVEFGNWNNQTERQDVMNHAYDALADLADVLGLPPKAIGMGGQLGLAFGARGQGLSGARAHYEPTYGAINLTKMSGAGSLAHEWFHALDHYFGRQDGKTPAQRVANDKGDKVFKAHGAEGDMVSHGFSRESGVREELRGAYKALIGSMMSKAERYVEDTQKVEKFVGDTKTQLADKLQALRNSLAKPLDPKYYKRHNGVATAEQLAEFDAIAERVIAGEGVETEWRKIPGLKAMSGARWTNDALEGLSTIYRSVRGRTGFDATNRGGVFDDLRGYMSRYSQRLQMLAANQQSPDRERQVPTSFAMEAKSIDQGRASNYWATPHEMAARAFQSYVEDKVDQKGSVSEFLTYGTNKVVPTPWGWKRPFPTGEERVAINKAFDTFVGEIKTREEDDGKVTMFSHGRNVGAGVPMRDARAVVALIREALPKAPPIHVHERVSQAPRALAAQIRAVNGDRTVHAAFHDGEIHVFPGNIASIEEMQFIVGHHEIRHYGMRSMLGPRLGPVMLAIYESNQAVKAAADAKTAAGLAHSRVEAVEEALADMPVEQVASMRGFGRLAALIRSWLRSIAAKLRSAGMTGLADSIEPAKWSDGDVARFMLKAEDISRSGGETFRAGGTVFDRDAGEPAASEPAKREPFDVKGATGNALAHYRGMAMQALGRRQIVELWSKDIPQLGVYNDLVQRMDADKNDAGAEADAIATAWGKLADERALAELMHDATLARIDPAKDYVVSDSRPEYDKLRKQWDALSADAKAIYTKARDSYEAHYTAVKDAIRERIERSQMSSDKRRLLLDRMDQEFFQSTRGVYFPLARFGKYLVVVKNAAGDTVSVTRAETLNEAETAHRGLLNEFPASKGFKVGKVLKDKEFNARRDGPGKGFMDELYQALEQNDASGDLFDAVSQLYLASLPDLSWAKHGIHRKGTPGFSQDARRAFAQNVFHGARYLAKLRYADQLQDQLTGMQDHVSEQATNDAFDSVKGQQVVDEMVKRHDSLMNPQSNPISTALTSAGFVFHLGLSPASAMVNLIQTPMVAYPIMGAKWGYDKAAAALLTASREAASNRNDIGPALKGDERAAYDEAVRTGVIDVTMAHDLAGIAQGEDAKLTWKLRPVMKWASFLFHHAEKFNRSVTFMAAYRLARSAGAKHAEAIEQAVDATYKGHFDYSSSNRPRLMQGNWAKVLLLFKQFGQNMVYTLSRQAYLAMKGATPAERTEARKALGGLLVTHAMGAGALGLPMVGTLLAAASWLGGSDDEPWDAEAALQNMLTDSLGPKAAEVLAHGLSRLTPWDISGRVGLSNMILPDIREGLEGRDLWESIAVSALGPVAAIAGGALDGMQQISQGKVATGLEAMLPAVLRAPVRAYRYGTDGAQDRSGITILDEVSAAGVAGQVLGLSPSEVRHATEGRSAIYRADKALVDRRATLMAMFAKAQMAGDTEGAAEAREAVAAFNEKNPGRGITPKQLMASVRARRRRIAQAEQGVYLPRNRRDALEAGRFAAVD